MQTSGVPAPYSPPPSQDAEHLKLLGIFHYVLGGGIALFGCIYIIFIIVGAGVMSVPMWADPAMMAEMMEVEGQPIQQDAVQTDDDAPQDEAEPVTGETIPMPTEVPPEWFFYLFGGVYMIIGGGIVLGGLTLGILTAWSGHQMMKRRRRMFSLVMAGFLCLCVPLGTILGVFTIVVLSRDSVLLLYGKQPAPQRAVTSS